MFQKELGEKIIAPFKSLNYGRLSIITSLKTQYNEYIYNFPKLF